MRRSGARKACSYSLQYSSSRSPIHFLRLSLIFLSWTLGEGKNPARIFRQDANCLGRLYLYSLLQHIQVAPEKQQWAVLLANMLFDLIMLIMQSCCAFKSYLACNFFFFLSWGLFPAWLSHTSSCEIPLLVWPWQIVTLKFRQPESLCELRKKNIRWRLEFLPT